MLLKKNSEKVVEVKAQEYICPEDFQKLPEFLPLKNSFHILSLKWFQAI